MRRKTPDNERAGIALALKGDWLAPVPIIADGVETREDSQGFLQLRAMPPVKPGFMPSLARKLGMRRQVRVNLDAYGSMFWRLIDGNRTLRDIERQIRQQTQQPQVETEKAVILFAKSLMRRHLIALAVPKSAE